MLNDLIMIAHQYVRSLKCEYDLCFLGMTKTAYGIDFFEYGFIFFLS